MTQTIRRIAVITGDHSLPDPTKRGASYHKEDLTTHEAMTAAFRSLATTRLHARTFGS